MTNPEFKEANAAIELAASDFVAKISEMFGKWEEVVPTYVLEVSLLELADRLTPLAVGLRPAVRPATSKLLDAMAAYRDSEFEDR